MYQICQFQVQMFQNGLIMSTANIIAQKAIEKKSNLDVRRTANFLIVGAFIIVSLSSIEVFKILYSYVCNQIELKGLLNMNLKIKYNLGTKLCK